MATTFLGTPASLVQATLLVTLIFIYFASASVFGFSLRLPATK
jgi:hypothetical protein